MLWIALTPLLLLGLAVGLVPVTIGIVHDHRARQNTDAYSHLFFQPRLPKTRSNPSVSTQNFIEPTVESGKTLALDTE